MRLKPASGVRGYKKAAICGYCFITGKRIFVSAIGGKIPAYMIG